MAMPAPAAVFFALPADKYGDPVFQATERMRQLIALMDPLDDELDALRAQWPNPYPFANDKLADPRAKALERIRELRRQIAVLGKEYWDISLEVNAAWHAQKPLWMKRFARERRK